MFSGAMANKTVIELGSMIAAPFATHVLNQLGAEVIKIEPPSGEITRRLVRGGPSGSYLAFNRGKKSLCLDLQTDEGRGVFQKLVKKADVIVHNLSPSAARKLGVTFEACNALNPTIVFCHIKGYGAGPLEEQVASNPIAEAATGVMFSNRIDGRPSRLGPSYHDQFAGCYAAIAVLSALLDGSDPARRNIELGLYETGLHIAARDLLAVQLKSQLLGRPEQEPSAEFSIPGYGAYETRDARWIYIVMLTDEHWRKFCHAVSLEEDPDLQTLRQRRKARAQVERCVSDAVRAHDFDVLDREFHSCGVGFTEVLPLDRVLDAPQAKTPGKCSDFAFGEYRFHTPDLPLPAHVRTEGLTQAPPLLGEQTQEILRSIGYTDEEIESLQSSGTALSAGTGAELWAKPGRTG